MEETGENERSVPAAALGELAADDGLPRVATSVARWSADLTGADAAFVWVPDPARPLFSCAGAFPRAAEKSLRSTAAREDGLAHDLVRDRAPLHVEGADLLTSDDPLLTVAPRETELWLGVPLEADGAVAGLIGLAFRATADPDEALAALDPYLPWAAPALARAARSDQRAAGMLRAIDRLTGIYDVTKAFGSTFDVAQLQGLVAQKAADLANAESASLWLLEAGSGEVALGATAINASYDVDPVPTAVGAAVVGDVIANREAVLRNAIGDDDPLHRADPKYPIRSLLALPLLEDEAPMGALVVANKRGRHPEFLPADEELLTDLAHQAVRALHHARQYQAEKKVEELDALLTVSREITATLDLDKVMQTIVNASAALVTYDRCAIAILGRGKLKLGAVSATPVIDRGDESIRRTESLLSWVYLGGSDVAVTEGEDGTIQTDRPETEEKFRAFFAESGRHAFYGVLLKDEEGKLGVLGFECAEPLVFDEETRDMVQILVNQATVAVRNAQLYQQVPLAGFWKPILERQRKLLGKIPAGQRLKRAAVAAAVLVLLFAVPWRLRVQGPARILPGRQMTVTAPVEGFLDSVRRREGDTVAAGEVIATLGDDRYRAELAAAKAALEIAESDLARYRTEGDSAASFQALARKDEARARIAFAGTRLEGTRVRAPVAGVIVTPRLEERVGQFLEGGGELCVVADVSEVSVEVAVPERDAALLKAGEPVWLKINPYPTRTFRGIVTRIGAALHEEGEERFVIAESRVENPDRALRTGMVGQARVSAGRHSLAVVLLRKPARWLWLKLWPLLP